MKIIFYSIRSKKAQPKNQGKVYGFPMVRGAWCNSCLKMSVLSKLDMPDITQYIGIAADEPNRFHNLTDRKRSPLVEHDITEAEARKICEELDLLSPIYSKAKRRVLVPQSPSIACLLVTIPQYWEGR